ncbi:MAG: hypothetical protein NW216_08555 [Hyphomicrobium sp.]|nr:hypothetical protein [Hyphomicrobium sp.]
MTNFAQSRAAVVRHTLTVLAIVALAPVAFAAGETAPAAPAAASSAVTWDQTANVRDAAERIAKIQRGGGAEAAFKHISACYRTHGLASNYSAPFEACIAQDYLHTRLLVKVYSRMQPDALKKMGAPTPDILAEAMGRRVTTAFKQYAISVAEAEKLKALVDAEGAPVFLKIVFPEAADELTKREKAGPGSEAKPEPGSEAKPEKDEKK